ACCLVLKRGAQRCPSGITDAFGQLVVAHHLGDPQVFERHSLVLTHEFSGHFLREVPPLPSHFLRLSSAHLLGFAAAVAALLTPRASSLRLGTLLVCLSGATGPRRGRATGCGPP